MDDRGSMILYIKSVALAHPTITITFKYDNFFDFRAKFPSDLVWYNKSASNTGLPASCKCIKNRLCLCRMY